MSENGPLMALPCPISKTIRKRPYSVLTIYLIKQHCNNSFIAFVNETTMMLVPILHSRGQNDPLRICSR